MLVVTVVPIISLKVPGGTLVTEFYQSCVGFTEPEKLGVFCKGVPAAVMEVRQIIYVKQSYDAGAKSKVKGFP